MRTNLLLGLLTAALLGACAGPDTHDARGGGGGRVSPGSPGAENPHAMVRDYMGNAMVTAARLHKLTMQGNTHAARADLGDIRRQLHLAQRWADPAERDMIAGLLARVDLMQQALDSADPTAGSESADLAQSFFGAFDQLAASGGGGRGGPRPSPEPRPRTPRPR